MVWLGKFVKIVFSDDNKDKVVVGTVTEETEFLITIIAQRTNDNITVGKKAIIKITEAEVRY